jgi:hypothetical protein
MAPNRKRFSAGDKRKTLLDPETQGAERTKSLRARQLNAFSKREKESSDYRKVKDLKSAVPRLGRVDKYKKFDDARFAKSLQRAAGKRAKTIKGSTGRMKRTK